MHPMVHGIVLEDHRRDVVQCFVPSAAKDRIPAQLIAEDIVVEPSIEHPIRIVGRDLIHRAIPALGLINHIVGDQHIDIGFRHFRYQVDRLWRADGIAGHDLELQGLANLCLHFVEGKLVFLDRRVIVVDVVKDRKPGRFGDSVGHVLQLQLDKLGIASGRAQDGNPVGGHRRASFRSWTSCCSGFAQPVPGLSR